MKRCQHLLRFNVLSAYKHFLWCYKIFVIALQDFCNKIIL